LNQNGIAQITYLSRGNVSGQTEGQEIKAMLRRQIPPTELWFAVSINPHCNLNCAGCNAFAPLAKEEYLDINEYQKDISRLSELANKNAHVIQLMGGEPLLNPRAIDYAIITRKFFPKARISFVTNGLLLMKLEERFYEGCQEYNIAIDITPYPIKFDYMDVIKFLDNKGIEWKYQDGRAVKVFRKEPFLLNPDLPTDMAGQHWLNCYMANNCVMLSDGKISCTKICNAKYFINYFEDQTKHMYLQEKDFIDIYKVQSIEEIFDFIAQPKPFCKFCNVGAKRNVEYHRSNKNIDEWID
jgi:organic radical activating enzyme